MGCRLWETGKDDSAYYEIHERMNTWVQLASEHSQGQGTQVSNRDIGTSTALALWINDMMCLP